METKTPTLNPILRDILEFESMTTIVDLDIEIKIQEEHEVYLSKQDLDKAIIGRVYGT